MVDMMFYHVQLSYCIWWFNMRLKLDDFVSASSVLPSFIRMRTAAASLQAQVSPSCYWNAVKSPTVTCRSCPVWHPLFSHDTVLNTTFIQQSSSRHSSLQSSISKWQLLSWLNVQVVRWWFAFNQIPDLVITCIPRVSPLKRHYC